MSSVDDHRKQLLNQLLAEQPKIDGALKSFASWWTAAKQQPAGDASWTLQEVLTATRLLSRSINAHLCAMDPSVMQTQKGVTKQELVPVAWNQVVSVKQKPTKLLGRTSLQVVWPDLDTSRVTQHTWNDDTKGAAYLLVFERLLFANMKNHQEDDDDDELVADSHFIWDADGGKAELARRAAERREKATQRGKQDENQLQRQVLTEMLTGGIGTAAGPTIEELPQEEEEKQQASSK